jgi:ribosome biogenesis GTPase
MITIFGWGPAHQSAFEPWARLSLQPGRVVAQHRGLWRIITAAGERSGRLSGRFAHEAQPLDHPVVGDWIALAPTGPDEAIIHAILPRASLFKRRAPGGGQQAIAANIDLALIVMALNGDLNPRRLERYLIAARDGGAKSLIVLTKADLSPDLDADRARIAAAADGSPLLTLSALHGEGLSALEAILQPGMTGALLGSSGVGKSTLLNALMGADVMRTADIRAGDDRGRHTTTHRELFRLPGGALVIDTPGMRELGLVAAEDADETSFTDIASLAAGCRFSDCSHQGEPGCAVAAALQSGALDPGRWRSFGKLQRERAFEARRDDPVAEAEHRAKWKRVHKNQRARSKHRNQQADGD